MTPAVVPDNPLAPISGSERIVALDIIRALALFGVLWMNFSTFSGAGTLATLGRPVGHGWLDALVSGIGGVLFRNKAMACFAMLFGIGLFIQFERAQARGIRPSAFAIRRLGGLFLIGLLHWCLIWDGDILTSYALVGCLLPFLLDIRPRTFLLLAIAAMVFCDALPLLVKVLHLPPWLDIFKVMEARAVPAEAVFAHGGWLACLKLRAAQWIEPEQVGFLLGCIPFAAPMFLVGALLWRMGIPKHASTQGNRLRTVFHATFWGGLVGSFLAKDPLKVIPEAWKKIWEGTPYWLLSDIATFSLAIGYLCGIILLLTHDSWKPRLGFLAPMGRMALTNYLSQSLVWTWVFNHYGLGFWGKVRPSLALVLVIAFYALQIAWSRWWLARFKFGPAEWLWRSMTYGKWQSFRIRVQPDALLPAVTPEVS